METYKFLLSLSPHLVDILDLLVDLERPTGSSTLHLYKDIFVDTAFQGLLDQRLKALFHLIVAANVLEDLLPRHTLTTLQ